MLLCNKSDFSFGQVRTWSVLQRQSQIVDVLPSKTMDCYKLLAGCYIYIVNSINDVTSRSHEQKDLSQLYAVCCAFSLRANSYQ